MSPDLPSPSTEAPDESGRPFWRHVSRVVDRFDALLAFLAIPAVTSLFQFERTARLLESGSREFSIHLGAQFPSPMLDLWSFVESPGSADGVTVDVPVGSGEIAIADADFALLAVIVPLLVAYAVVASVLYAIYVGGIDRRLRGEPAAPLECVTRYAARFLGYFVVLFTAGAAFVLVVALFFFPAPGALAAVLLLVIPALLVLAYLFYAVPFLFVIADASLVDAFVRSYRLALAGGSYLTFALWHLAVTLVASPLLSILVIPGGPFALLLGLAVAAPLSLVLTAATVSFLRELVDDGRLTDDSWGGGGQPAESGSTAGSR